jgi:hypothetical protein
MRGALTAAGLAVAVGDLWLVVICWNSRSVLAGFLGATGIPIVLLAVVAGLAENHREVVLLVAAIMLVVGIGLYGVGQSIQRLLDREPDDDG